MATVTPKLRIDDHDLAREVSALQGVAEDTVTVTLAAGAANVCTITIQAVDGFGAAITGVRELDLHFSTSAVGANITATAYSGTLVAVTGVIKQTITAAKAFSVLTDANGLFVGSLTATAKPAGEYVAVRRPRGTFKMSAATVTGSYG